jgi:hypothetical protein
MKFILQSIKLLVILLIFFFLIINKKKGFLCIGITDVANKASLISNPNQSSFYSTQAAVACTNGVFINAYGTVTNINQMTP